MALGITPLRARFCSWCVLALALGVSCSGDGSDEGSGGTSGTSGTGGSGGTGGSSGASGAAGLLPDASLDANADAGDGAADSGPGGGASFELGAEYAAPGLAPPYGKAGVRWTKLPPGVLTWQRVEPQAPVSGSHAYDWSCVDALVLEYQAAGLDRVQVYVNPKSYWGSVSCPNELSCKDIAPSAAHMVNFRAWMAAAVERYDGDGVADAPGLLAPVRDWVVGAEWTGFWPGGNPDGYITTLEAAADEIRKADGAARVGLIPFLLTDAFIGNPPSAAQIQKALTDPPPAWRNSTAGMLKMLDRPELFDYVDVHSLGDYTEIPPTLDYLRAQMSARGYSRPIWIDDAFPIGYLANGGTWPASWSVTDKAKTYQTLLSMADPAAAGYATTLPWIRAEVARGLIKKIAVSAASGARGIQIGNTVDWMHDTLVEGPTGRKLAIYLLGASAMMGLIDATHPGGYGVCDQRVPGAARAAMRNLELVVSQLSGYDAVEPITGLGPGIWAYRFAHGAKPVIVAWHEDDVLQLPGETEAVISAGIPLPGATSALVTRAATDLAATPPVATPAPVSNGVVQLELDATPVLIAPGP